MIMFNQFHTRISSNDVVDNIRIDANAVHVEKMEMVKLFGCGGEVHADGFEVAFKRVVGMKVHEELVFDMSRAVSWTILGWYAPPCWSETMHQVCTEHEQKRETEDTHGEANECRCKPSGIFHAHFNM